MAEVNNNLNVRRAQLRITQKELAEKVGVSRQTIHAIETEKFEPSSGLALKITNFFKGKVSDVEKLEDIFTLKEKTKK